MIDINDIHFSYGKTDILSGVNMQIPRGEITVLLGRNGCGKSTFLKILSGDVKPMNGQVLYDNTAIDTYSLPELALKRAVIRQASPILFDFSVYDIVSNGRFPYEKTVSRHDNKKIIDNAIVEMQLQKLQNQSFNTLSGGERTRAKFASVIAQTTVNTKQKPYIFLDEPNASLDISHTLGIMEYLKTLANAGHGIFIILHDINLAFKYADNIYLIKKGEIYAKKTPDSSIKAKDLEDVYNVKVETINTEKNNRPYYIFR